MINTPLNRRHFLRLAALAPLAAATPSDALTGISRAGGASFMPGLNAYSFLEQLNANMADAGKGMDLFGVCDFCAKHDIEAVDLTGYFFPGYPKAPADRHVNRMKRYAHDRGITLSGTGVRNDFATADKAVRAEAVVKRVLDGRLRSSRCTPRIGTSPSCGSCRSAPRPMR